MTLFLDNTDTEVKAPSSRSRKTIGWIAAVLIGVIGIAFICGYIYWRSFSDTPQYSLAMLVDAARRGDQAKVDEIVEVNSIVDEFLPQITDKAIELYGRGLPPKTINRVARVATPILPAVKERARTQLPGIIRKKTARFESVPFAAMVVGADRYLDIRADGDIAVVRSKLPEHGFEVRMQRNGNGWKIVAIRDEALATEIAQKIGQEIIAVASHGSVEAAGERLGIKNLNMILRQAEEIFR